MGVVEEINGVQVTITQHKKTNEVYIKTLDETVAYLNAKGLDFISKEVKDVQRGFINEWCITELPNGYVLEVGICGDFAPFGGKYITIYKTDKIGGTVDDIS